MKPNQPEWIHGADPSPPSPPAIVRLFQVVSLGSAALVCLIGLVVWVGWGGDSPELGGLLTMKPNTAVGLMLGGISLALLLHPGSKFQRLAGRSAAAVMLGLGLATAAEFAFKTDFGIDDWVPRAFSADVPGDLPVRMLPISAFCLTGLGLGLLFLDGRTRAARVVGEVSTLSALLAAVLGLAGYAYHISELYQIGHFSTLAIHSAIGFLVLSIGTLAATPAARCWRGVFCWWHSSCP